MVDFCIPFGRGVPFASQPPGFWRDAGTDLDSHNKRLDDPRWTGASRVGYGASPDPGASGGPPGVPSGSSEHGAVRALYHTHLGPALYFVWRLSVDPLADEQDRLYVGFGQRSTIAAASRYFVARIRPALTATDPFEALKWEESGMGPTAVYFEGNGSTYNPAIVPSSDHWLRQNVRSWKITDRGWAVALRVPIVAGGGLGGLDLDIAGFKFWFELKNRNRITGGISLPERWHFPLATGPADEENVDPSAWFPPLAQWSDARHGTSCAADLSLSYANVGTANGAGTNAHQMLIGFAGSPPVASNPQPQNRFFAQLDFDGSPALPDQAVKAHFYIANWGSQIGHPPSNVPGSPLGELGAWTLVTSGSSAAVAAGATNVRVEALWQATPQDAQLFLPLGTPTASRTRHQCIFVQCEGPGLTFANDSVSRNMDFVSASLFERDAEISVRGLGTSPDGNTHRNVYLYVQALNMPPQIEPGGGEGDEGGEGDDGDDLNRLRTLLWKSRGQLASGQHGEPTQASGSGEGDEGDRLKKLRSLLWKSRGQLAKGQHGEPTQASGSGLPLENAFDLLENYLPTYKVHVYHETDEFVQENGRAVRTIRPQTSFGYFLDHDGELHGWDHQIVGADRIAPNLWKVRVPNDGVVRVNTRILAKEKPEDELDHSGDSKSECQRAVEPILEQLQELRVQLARCCPRSLRIQAEHFLATGGVRKDRRVGYGVERLKGWIGNIHDGDWALYGNVDFGSGPWTKLKLSLVTILGGRQVTVYADTPESLDEYVAAAGKKAPDRLKTATRLTDAVLPANAQRWLPQFGEQTTNLLASPSGKKLLVLSFGKGGHLDPFELMLIDWLEFLT